VPLFETMALRIPVRRALNVLGDITNASIKRTCDQASRNQQLKGENPEEHKNLLCHLGLCLSTQRAVN
jgi:hypothetical protein